tara:strand:- start:129 stop:617 length:489 start_codon:yes stop_codon:yes gene_type:complete
MIYDRKTYEERRDALLSKRTWIINGIATVAIIASLAVLSMMQGCAHSRAANSDGLLGTGNRVHGYMSTRAAPNSQSMCFNGLLRSWEYASCNQFGYEKLDDGYYKHWCADEGSANSIDPYRSWDFFIILWNPSLNQYSRPIPEGTAPVCGDPYAIIVSSERD